MKTKKSPLMDELYGIEQSNQVYKMLENLDPELNKEVQEIAYEHYWARSGLVVRDKSLITLSSLISLGKEKQIRPHIVGFLNTGGTKEELINVLCFLNEFIDKNMIRKAISIADEVFNEQSEIQYYISAEDFNQTKAIECRDTHLAKIASSAAIGINENTKLSIKNYLIYSNGKSDDVRNLLIHLIPYCGFPVSINGFNALKDALSNEA